MNKVAKLVIIDKNNHYLLMYRNDHPRFGNDPDIPGGTLEAGEEPIDAMVREVHEEAGVTINATQVRKVHEGTDYSHNGTHYSLYTATLDDRPDVTLSWEHTGFEWLERDDFLNKAKHAADDYMNMVYDLLK